MAFETSAETRYISFVDLVPIREMQEPSKAISGPLLFPLEIQRLRTPALFVGFVGKFVKI
jgi:hypothetical protein